MRTPSKRTLKIRYNPNPKAERFAIKAICKALDHQRGGGKQPNGKENAA